MKWEAPRNTKRMMRLRIIGFFASVVLWPSSTPPGLEAQQSRELKHIGYLNYRSGPNEADEAFRQALRNLGWTEGQNIVVEYRWAAGKRERYRALAAELVQLDLDVIVTVSRSMAQAAKNATRTIPIVMTTGADAVEHGIVESLARPGGNITGLSEPYADLHAKVLELLHETLPSATRVAFLWNPTVPGYARAFKAIQDIAPTLGLTVQSLAYRNAEELQSVLETAVQERPDALVVPSSIYNVFGAQIAALATQNRLSVFSTSRRGVEEHFGLLTYIPDWREMFRGAATYVDKILRGEKPADLPIQRPVKFDLIVNLRTARQLGITVPSSILYRMRSFDERARK